MEFLIALNGRVTNEMNAELTKPFMAQEVEEALHQVIPTKAPRTRWNGSNIFSTILEYCGRFKTTAVLQALNDGHFLGSLNHTFIALIPKGKKRKRESK